MSPPRRLTQEALSSRSSCSPFGCSRNGRTRDRPFAERRGALGADKFVELAGRQHQQKSFPYGLGRAAFRTIKLARGKTPKLLLHAAKTSLCASEYQEAPWPEIDPH
jgi:hypothetical protein